MKLERTNFFSNRYDAAPAVLRQAYGLPKPEPDPETERWYEARRTKAREIHLRRGGALEDFGRGGKRDNGIVLHEAVALPNSILAKMNTDAPAYRMDLGGILFRPRVVADLAFKDGARAAARGQTFLFRRIVGEKPLLIITQPAVTTAGLWYSGAISNEFRNWLFSRHIKAVNRVTGDITWVGENQQGSQHLQIAGVMINRNIPHIDVPTVIRDDRPLIKDPQWEENTMLVVLADEEVARFRREIAVDKFPLRPVQPVQDGDGAEAPANEDAPSL